MQHKPNLRIGYGVDVHQLAAGYPLWIGGIQIPSEFGAVGHSDADVLIHAICDALLGALALRDIGFHFSDQDPQFKGIDSKILLEKVFQLISEKGYGIVNIDATVILETPKVNPHIEKNAGSFRCNLKSVTRRVEYQSYNPRKGRFFW